MPRHIARSVAALAFLTLPAAPVFAGQPKTYQVTGPVVDVTPDTITVQKGRENWEIGKTSDTKVTGDVKNGEKVTVTYRMTATSIEWKAAGTPQGKTGHSKY